MVNRVDKLTLHHIDTERLQQFATWNRHMNSFVLRIPNVTVQVFSVSKKAMCFTRTSHKNMSKLIDLLRTKYGIHVKHHHLCTTTWSGSLSCNSVNLYYFYSYCREHFSTCSMWFEPELFPCITLLYKSVTTRIFHSGKIILLGVKNHVEAMDAANFICTTFIAYSMQKYNNL